MNGTRHARTLYIGETIFPSPHSSLLLELMVQDLMQPVVHHELTVSKA